MGVRYTDRPEPLPQFSIYPSSSASQLLISRSDFSVSQPYSGSPIPSFIQRKPKEDEISKSLRPRLSDRGKKLLLRILKPCSNQLTFGAVVVLHLGWGHLGSLSN